MTDLEKKCADIRRRIAEIRASLDKDRPPVFEKGYPNYDAVNRDNVFKSNPEMDELRAKLQSRGK